MWLCASRGRPTQLKRLADSWERTASKEAELVVRLDEDDSTLDQYRETQWPESWGIFVEDSLQGASGAMRWAFEKFPNEKFYGALGDDVVLYTPGWDTVLKASAGDWFLSYPDDGFQHGNLATHPCCGGELLRALGYWTLPDLHHYYGDTVLHTIAKRLDLLKYCPNILFEHMHPVAGKAFDDATYRRSQEHWESDTAVFNAWLAHKSHDDTRRVFDALRRKTQV